ncbi:homeobox protein [Planoprotostelium fungivorum]|uniref:Homeobox protein n=1 Tax=Planoprotostelium fungivorum TaxID=1890364 RepID=A0A2P6NY05_9EUKA|nr:homeobox protein [Planoprotostelium fungivorum]
MEELLEQSTVQMRNAQQKSQLNAEDRHTHSVECIVQHQDLRIAAEKERVWQADYAPGNFSCGSEAKDVLRHTAYEEYESQQQHLMYMLYVRQASEEELTWIKDKGVHHLPVTAVLYTSCGHTVSPLHWSEGDSYTHQKTKANRTVSQTSIIKELFLEKLINPTLISQIAATMDLLPSILCSKGEKCFRRERIPPQSPYFNPTDTMEISALVCPHDYSPRQSFERQHRIFYFDDATAMHSKSETLEGSSSRMTFTRQQIDELVELYGRTTYPTMNERQTLARKFRTSPRRIQVWFQNRRARREKTHVV